MDNLVSANLLLSEDKKATLDGRSAPLSFPADRERFHALRKKSDLILIGGNTARNEPYQHTPLPLFVLSRHPMTELTANNQFATILQCPLAQAIDLAKREYQRILIEAGPVLVTQGLSEKVIDILHLSISKKLGDLSAPSVELSQSLTSYALVSDEEVDGGRFLTYHLAPTKE